MFKIIFCFLSFSFWLFAGDQFSFKNNDSYQVEIINDMAITKFKKHTVIQLVTKFELILKLDKNSRIELNSFEVKMIKNGKSATKEEIKVLEDNHKKLFPIKLIKENGEWIMEKQGGILEIIAKSIFVKIPENIEIGKIESLIEKDSNSDQHSSVGSGSSIIYEQDLNIKDLYPENNILTGKISKYIICKSNIVSTIVNVYYMHKSSKQLLKSVSVTSTGHELSSIKLSSNIRCLVTKNLINNPQ